MLWTIPDSQIVSLNYLPDNVPLDAKFILESNFTNFKLKPGTNSNADNFVVSNYDLPKGGGAERAKTNSQRGNINCPTKQIKRSARQIKCLTEHAKCPARKRVLGLLNTENCTEGICIQNTSGVMG